MFGVGPATRIYLSSGVTDMRKGFEGLYGLVRDQLRFAEQGYLRCGANGAGHFVKMVHNGIEYGVMAAYAEGLAVLRDANIGRQTDTIDAETTPLREPSHYQKSCSREDDLA